jgi:methyl-CpG-binding domain protein 4
MPSPAPRAVVRSKYFAPNPSPTPAVAHVDGATVTAHATLRDAVRAAGDALEEYLAIAKIKNAHDAHERAAHEVLRHFRGAVRAFERSTTRDVVADDDKGKGVDVTDIDALSSLAFEGADGATDGARTPQRRRERRGRDELDEPNATSFDSPDAKRRVTASPRVKIKPEYKKEDVLTFEADAEDAIARAGDVLQNMLQEIHRLHVNASCRVKSRAPEVARARDNLTAIRREARMLFRRIDPEGFRRDKERLKMVAEETQAALDSSFTQFDAPPKDLHELRAKCPVMAATQSPHHLCAHLCYYREYEPARQLYVLRCRAAESKGSAKALDGWRAELAVRPAEDIPAINRSRADARGTASGACSLKHFPWMVEFVAPDGSRYRDGMDVLNAVDVECDNLSWPRASHGGNGIREARVGEDGLTDQTELLRAALWPEAFDGEAGTTPVRRSFSRVIANGGEVRSPLTLAPDPLANDENDNFTDARAIVADHHRHVQVVALDEDDDDDDDDDKMKTPESSQVQIGDVQVSPGSGPDPVRHWWAPPLSPFGLLEEILWQDEWKLLVACMMLNCTTRLQVDRVLWRLFLLAPTAADAARLGATHEGLEALERIIAPLGLHRKRTNAFVKLSIDVEAQRAKHGGRVKNVSACHGVGVYASDAHALFVDGVLAGPPRDHALRWYHAWAAERRDRRVAAARAAAPQ